jgi:hypothetical protein
MQDDDHGATRMDMCYLLSQLEDLKDVVFFSEIRIRTDGERREIYSHSDNAQFVDGSTFGTMTLICNFNFQSRQYIGT